ncbi:MAG: DUF3352 domain-containing protein [Algoriphagus sp.]|nr:DUF3352 domain-containing protein [Algoriphagus sp.]
MKIWKSLLIILALSLLGWGGYEVYQRFILSRTINSLELISSDAIFIFETQQADYTLQELRKQPVWTALSRFPAIQSLDSQLNSLDGLVGEQGFVTKTLRNKQVTVSYHAVGTDKFSLLYTLNFGSSSPQELLDKLKSKAPKNTRFQTRKYSEREIYDVLNENNSIQWSITLLNNVLLVSSSSFVIEEAIRFYLSEDASPISTKLGDNLPNQEGLGRLLLSSKGLAKLLAGVSEDKNSSTLQELQAADYLLALTLQFEDQQLLFKGPIQGLPAVDFLPSVQAQLVEFENLISKRTHSITQINLKDSYETQKIFNSTFAPISTVSGEVQTRLIDRGFLDLLSGEQYYLELKSGSPSEKNSALLIKTTKAEQAWELLKEYRDTTDFYPTEQYLGNEILFFSEENFPAHLFNGRFIGFDQTYISLVDQLLVMSNSALGMRTLLDDYSQGNTWAKNPNETTLLTPAAGYSKTYLLPRIWPTWVQSTNPTWNTFLQKYAAELQAFTSLALRIHQSSKGPEATLIINYTSEGTTQIASQKSFELASGKEVVLPANLIYGPKAIKNFNDGTEDLVIQDQNHVLYVINSAGEQVFSQPLSGPILSEAFQIDYFKNGKLQLVLATSDRIYAIDRLGDPLPGFPKAIPGEKITHLSVLDYDQTLDYRYFIATEIGNLWLFDKMGKDLENWNPLPLGEPTNGAPFHVRVPGKGDFMVVLGISGELHFFSRKGESRNGPPLQLPAGIGSPLIFKKTGTPTLHTITTGGEVIEISFSGEILKKTQVQKTTRDDKFRELPDQKGNGTLLVVEQFSKIQFFDNQRALLVTLSLKGEQTWLGYFDFGSSRKIIAVTDRQQGLGYLYDLKGNLLISTPLQSEGEIQISHQPNQGQYLIRTRFGKNLLEYLIPD